MTFTEEQVEWIVVEVLRRLGVMQVQPNQSTLGGELRVNERVITMRLVEGRLAGVRRLVVPVRTVVTPAVKDELKMRNIELVFERREH